MIKRLEEKFVDAVSSIMPVMVIMVIVGLFLDFNIVTIISILISTLLLIFGVTLFTLGADLSMMEMGKIISSGLLKVRKVWVILLVSFVVGVVITVAEPDLKVLAEQMTAVDSSVLIWSIGIGVGIFLSIAAARIIYQMNLKKIIGFCYIILLLIMLVSNNSLVPFAFDSGGVTTGSMSVPFILAMGIGFSVSMNKRESKNDSFGLVALCSIGPVLVVLLLGLFLKSDMSYTYNIQDETLTLSSLGLQYLMQIWPVFKDVLLSLLPIVVVFSLFCLITKGISRRQIFRILVGLPITLVGLMLFFIGVNVGYLPVAYLIGINMFNKAKFLLVPLGLIIGFVSVKAEPAVVVLTEQIEKLTEGSIKKSVMNNTIAIGVALAVAISIFRVVTGVSINGFLIVGYLVAIVLMYFSPDLFTMVAFDAGGAVPGVMTTSFLLPLIIGICYACGGNVLTDAFGLVALVAVSPLIVVQFLGVIYRLKSKKKLLSELLDESIVEFEWGDIVE